MVKMSLMLTDNRRSQPAGFAHPEIEVPVRPAAVTADEARMYEAERAQRLLLEAALESLPLGVAILDGRTLVVRWANRACRQQLSRISRIEAIEGRHLRDIVPGSDENGLSEIVHRVAATGRACADLAFAFPDRSGHRGDAGVIYARFALRKVGGYDGEFGEVMLQITEMTSQAGSRGRSRNLAAELQLRNRQVQGMD